MEPTGREPAVRDGSGESLDLTGSAEDGAELGELLGVEEGLALGDEEGELVGEEEGTDVGAYGKRTGGQGFPGGSFHLAAERRRGGSAGRAAWR